MALLYLKIFDMHHSNHLLDFRERESKKRAEPRGCVMLFSGHDEYGTPTQKE